MSKAKTFVTKIWLIIVPMLVGGLFDVSIGAGRKKAGLALVLGLFAGIVLFISMTFIDLVTGRGDDTRSGSGDGEK